MDVNFTEQLIQEVRNRPILYLIDHPDYKNKAKKLQAWREIQRVLNEEVNALKAKWKNLKDTYKKFKQSRQSTSGQTSKKLSNWVWAGHMSFMEPSDSLNDTQISIDYVNAKVEHDDEPANSTENIEEVWQEIDSIQESSSIAETQNGPEIYRRKRKRINTDPTDIKVQYFQNRRRARNRNDDKVEVRCDGVDLLFLGYSNTFKNLSNRKQISVKFDIAKILMEAELSDLHDNETMDSATPGSYSAPSTTLGSY